MTSDAEICIPLHQGDDLVRGDMVSHLPLIGRRAAARALLFAALLLIQAGCSTKKESPAPPPPGVTVAPVVQRDVPIYREWVGTMLGNIDADIRPKVEGFLLQRLYAE